MRIVNILNHIHDGVSKACFYFSAALILVLTINIGYEVVSRYFFLSPTAWALDFSEYILIYSTFLAAPWLYKLGGHVSINVMVNNLGVRPRLLIEVFTGIVGWAVTTIVTLRVGFDTVDAFTRNVLIVRPVLMPKYAIMWVIPFGAMLLSFYFLKSTLVALSTLRNKD